MKDLVSNPRGPTIGAQYGPRGSGRPSCLNPDHLGVLWSMDIITVLIIILVVVVILRVVR